MVDIDHAVEVLNRIHQLDPTVLPALIVHRVPCNAALSEDPTVQVGYEHFDGPFEVGFLGVLNGIFGVDDNGCGFIAAKIDDNGDLTHFEKLGDEELNDRTNGAPT